MTKPRKKRFSFADAKEKIKDLEEQLKAAQLESSDNIYTSMEKKWIYFYKYSALTFYGLIIAALILALSH